MLVGAALACGGGDAEVGGDGDEAGVSAPNLDAGTLHDEPSPGGPVDAAADAPGANDAPFAWPSPAPPCNPPLLEVRLSQTCLYDDIATQKVRADVVEFEPANALWTDGAAKRRWIWLPPGSKVDTSNMDFWKFPVGTRVWKEFSLGGVRLETRLIERTGSALGEYRMVSYRWRANGSDADAAPLGASNVLGTEHDIPSALLCRECHDGEPGRVLGFSAIQLSHDGPGVTLAKLAASGKLSHPPPTGTTYRVPGNAVQSKALGYLHANCGHCHHPEGGAYALVNQILRLDVATVALGDPTQTKTYTTTIGQATTALIFRQSDTRVKAGKPSESDMWLRMGLRSNFFPPPHMPPYGTEKVDTQGRAAIEAWIAGL